MRTRRVLLAGAGLAAVLASGGARAGAQELPTFSAPVVDAAGVVPDDVQRDLDAELQGFQDRTGRQLAVAVVDTTSDRSIEDYANDLFEAWGVGDAERDDGTLLVVAVDDRTVRIEVGGGVEGDLTDIEAAEIVDDVLVPHLRDEGVTAALLAAVPELRRALGDAGGPDPAGAPAVDEPGSGGSILPLLLLGVFVMVLLGGLGGGRRRSRRRRGGTGFGPLLVWGGLGGFGGGGGGFGGGGGGFGGGGGGGSFGGGASGGW